MNTINKLKMATSMVTAMWCLGFAQTAEAAGPDKTAQRVHAGAHVVEAVAGLTAALRGAVPVVGVPAAPVQVVTPGVVVQPAPVQVVTPGVVVQPAPVQVVTPGVVPAPVAIPGVAPTLVTTPHGAYYTGVNVMTPRGFIRPQPAFNPTAGPRSFVRPQPAFNPGRGCR